ncbi:MAG: M23 family metallopeptidase [bacterium]|nr:M23 family metallopeptidase [bacterium]
MRKRRTKRARFVLAVLGLLLLFGFAIPARPRIPVDGATHLDWNDKTFWHHPWGASGVHKGIDVFAAQGTPVIAATPGLVIYSGRLDLGGNVVSILGPRWRVHYYAHMDEVHVTRGLVGRGTAIGSVGTSGNAAGKPPHLHYAVVTLIPYPWRFDLGPQGWKKMFYLDPGDELT